MRYEIRPMSFGEILDMGFRIVRDHFVLLVGIGLVLWVPLEIFSSLLERQPNTTGGIASAVVLGLTVIIVSPVVTAAVTHAIGEFYLDRAAGLGESLRTSFAIFLPLIGTWILVTLAIALGLVLLVIPGIYLMLAFMLVTQVMVLERVFGPSAMRRSRELLRDNLLRAAGIYLLILVLGAVLSGGITLMLSFVPLLAAVAEALVQSVLLAYSSAAFVVLYFDIRCRKEAFDLQHLARLVEGEGERVPAAAG